MRFEGHIPAIAGLLAGLVLAGLAASASRAVGRRRGRRRSRRGHRLEAEAADALARLGFRVLRRHPTAEYEVRVDGEIRRARVEGDYLVTRGGRRYLVEVKSGADADPMRRRTRRQLLEYALHFPVDGVLLLDADRGRLHRVEFPQPPRRASVVRVFWFVLGGVAGGVLATAFWPH